MINSINMFVILRRVLLLEPVIKNIPSLTSITNITTFTEDTTKCERPPGPKKWPLLGSLPSALRNKAFDKERLHLLWDEYAKQYGPVFQFTPPGSPTMNILSNIGDIEKLYKITSDKPIRPFFDAFKVANQRCPSKFYKEGEYGLLNEQGDVWWRIRRRVQPYAMKPSVVSLYLPGMDQIAKDFVERIEIQRDENLEVPGDFISDLMKWSLENVGLIAFNKRIVRSEEGLEIIKAVDTIVNNVGKLEYGVHLWRYIQTPKMYQLMKARDSLRRHIMKSVLHAEESLKKDVECEKDLNMLERLLKTPGLSHRDVVMFMMDFFIAGVDTTAFSMSFILYLLSVNPEKQVILQHELDKVLGDGSEELMPAHLAKLTYTKAVVKEALRMFPVAMAVGRQLNHDEIFSGYTVTKGSFVCAFEYPNCYDEQLFYNPKEFLPERWLRHRPYGHIQNYACFTFSRGTRSCIGRRISEQEMYSLIARLFHKYTLEWKYEKLNPKLHLLLHPDLPLKFTIKERDNKNLSEQYNI